MIQEVFSRLILYNYTSMIAHQVNIPEGKRVNFPVAAYLCRQFLRNKLSCSQVLKAIVKHLSPIRPGRQFPRFQNLISAVGFQYRFSGLSQILCKHRNAVQIEQNLFKAEVARAAAALFSK